MSLRRPLLGLVLSSLPIAACASIAGVSDFHVDDSLDGASPDGTGSSSGTDAPVSMNEGGGSDGSSSGNDGQAPTVGLSDVTLSLASIMVGKTSTATLHVRNDNGDAVKRAGAKVAFTVAEGTATVTVGPTTDNGDGTYSAVLTGTAEGTPLKVSATLDGATLKSTPPLLRVENVITNGLTIYLDADDVDGAGHAGNTACPTTGIDTWKDLSATGATGQLTMFDDTCTGAAGSGWAGTGTAGDPHRLVFDGTNDFVGFGAINGLPQHTIIAFVKKTGAGTAGITGTGGFGAGAFPNIFPVVVKGTAEAETDDVDINYHLSITEGTNKVGSDFEAMTSHTNAPMMGNTALTDNSWNMIATSLSPTARAVWVNGTSDGTAGGGVPSGAATARFAIGGANQTTGITPDRGRLKGEIGVVLTYNRALTSAEMEQTCRVFAARFGITACPK